MRQRKLMNEINVVPYIDVMLVLLVIFMITAPLMNPGQIDLPSVGRIRLSASASRRLTRSRRWRRNSPTSTSR